MTKTILVAIVMVGCATAPPAASVDAGPPSDAGPGIDSGDYHIPECDVVGEQPYCPPGYPLVCPNGHWARPDGTTCQAGSPEAPPACTTTGGIAVVPHCTHGAPYCLPPDPTTGCPD